MSGRLQIDARIGACRRHHPDGRPGRRAFAAAVFAVAVALPATAPVAETGEKQGRQVIRFGAGGISGATCGPDRTAQPDCAPRAKGFAIPYYTMASLPPGVDVAVRARFDITAAGAVENLVLEHDGLPPEVERTLRAEVSRWVYTPGRRGGTDVAFPGQSLKFTLRSGSGRPRTTDQVSETARD